MNNKPELLAPAGSIDSLYAAVTAGANAVYLGVDRFNARRGADNFTLETLGAACDYAHLREVKVYLTLNTLVLPDELNEALELARQAYRCGIDAIIVQDIGLIRALSQTLPDLPVHASTQLNTHSQAGIEALAELGVKRVTLARELSAEEVARLSDIAHDLGMQVETFVHGALCVCYSGQCYMSSMIGGRSANRGLCAQACRLPYELRNKALRKPLSSPGQHLLSPKDLCLIDHLPELSEAGVASLKIEGRMKSAEYVHTVTKIYRSALDAVSASDESTVSDYEKRQLAEAFSRGFTSAYFTNDRDNDIMSYARPNNRGVSIGRVEEVLKDQVIVRVNDELHTGDVLEFWTGKGNFTHTVTSSEESSDRMVTLSPKKLPKKGDRVFRVRQQALSFEGAGLEPKIPIAGIVSLKIGKPLSITFADLKGRGEVTLTGDPVEAARTKEVTEAEVTEHIDRLGSTPYKLEGLKVELDEGVGISFSTLHKARSRALEMLTDMILVSYADRKLSRIEKISEPEVFRPRTCEVAVFASNPTCARAARKAGAELIYIPAQFYKRGEASIAGQVSETVEQAGYPKKSIIAFPEIEHDAVGSTRESLLEFGVWDYVSAGKPVMVENLGQLHKAAQLGMHPEVGPHLSMYNKQSLYYAAEKGASRVWLSPELSLGQISDLADESPLPLGLTVIGAQKLMTTEHCLLMSQGPCNQVCATCPRRKSPHYLKDRKGYEFTVITDLCGRSHLYNAVQLDIAHAVADLIRAGVSALMVDATLMTSAETSKAVARVVRARDIARSGDNHVSKTEGTTSGHLFRGVQ